MNDFPVLRCAPAAQLRGDLPTATATPVTRWLLVEQPGAWGLDAVRQSGLDPAIAERLLTRTAANGVRLLMIRRYGRPVPGPRRWAYVDSRPGLESTYWGRVSADSELLAVALDGTSGATSPDPVYLVCTHGRHDACCAIRGRRVAAALTEIRPDATWECSHVGGDRFAANLVILPHGLFYGQVTADGAAGVVTGYEAGQVVPGLLRGRSTFSGPVQAAQHFARMALADYAVAALSPIATTALPGQVWSVRLAATGGELAVTVSAHESPPARLTCAGTRNVVATTFRLESLQPLPKRPLPGAAGSGQNAEARRPRP